MPRHRLTDQQWDAIKDISPPPARTGRPPRDRREIVDAILGVLRTGAPWRDLPEGFGPWGTAWDLFDRWNADGTLDTILSRLRSARIDAGEVDDELWCVDGTSVRAARCAAGGGKKGTPRSPRTRPWDAPAGALPRRSTCCATATATPSTSI
jgi:transposase